MEPENTAPVEVHTKRNFSLIALLGVLIIVGVIIILLPQESTLEQNGEVKINPAEKKVYTQTEKEQILARLAASVPTDTTSQAERERILRNLAKTVPADKTSPEEKIRILAELAASVEQ